MVRTMASGVSALSGFVANGHQFVHPFPLPSPFIPYGGFSPVRLEASLSAPTFRFYKRLSAHSWSLGDRHMSRRFYPPKRPSPYSRLPSNHRLYPQALLSAEVMLSSTSPILRPDPPVSQTPPRLTVSAARCGLYLVCVTFPSLLWSLGEHAVTLTPPAGAIRLMAHPDALRTFVAELRTRLTGLFHLNWFLVGSFSKLRVHIVLRPVHLPGLLTSPRPALPQNGPALLRWSLPPVESPLQRSTIATRPNHPLPRRDFHPLARQRSKAAQLRQERCILIINRTKKRECKSVRRRLPCSDYAAMPAAPK